jgi:hypothetical protein
MNFGLFFKYLRYNPLVSTLIRSNHPRPIFCNQLGACLIRPPWKSKAAPLRLQREHSYIFEGIEEGEVPARAIYEETGELFENLADRLLFAVLAVGADEALKLGLERNGPKAPDNQSQTTTAHQAVRRWSFSRRRFDYCSSRFL